MKLSVKIWKEFGALAQYVELVDHDSGEVRIKAGTSPENVSAIEAIVASHDPTAFDPEQQRAALEAALDAHIDGVAKAKGYDSRITAALRAGYNNPWQAEGAAFGSWMDTCYAKANEIQAAVEAGERPVPTVEELIAEMPEMVWP